MNYKLIIEQCQGILATYLNPSCSQSKNETIRLLLDVLDNEYLVRYMRNEVDSCK